MKTNIRKYVNIKIFYSSFALDHLIMLNPQIKCSGFNCICLKKQQRLIVLVIFKAFNVLSLKKFLFKTKQNVK